MNKVQLGNGIRLVMEEIPASRSVAFGVWVKVGSRNENESTNGISHLIEHMLFKGTEKYGVKEIAEIFDGIGGNVNAFTTKEYTCYYTKVLDEHLPIAVDVLADMFFHSKFDPEELQKEKSVILEEIAMYEDAPDDLVHDLVAKAAYGDHPLGYSILGTEPNLERFEPDDLREYMKSHYFLENTVISLAGHIDSSAVELIERHFGGYRHHGRPVPVQPADYFANRLFHGKKTEQNHLCLSLPGCSLQDERLYQMILLNNAIGGGMSSSLFQEIREKRGLAYSIYSYHSSHIDGGLFTIYAGSAPKQTEEVLKVTMDVLESFVVNGMSESELAKGKQQLKGSLILGLESSGSLMNRNGKNELMLGRHDTLDQVVRKIEAVSPEDIRTLIQDIFSHSFALSMVGQSDRALTHFRRGPFVVQSSN